jgi:peptidoglycan/xylan/chitin deacetylase (PgdA/CDA1 family)
VARAARGRMVVPSQTVRGDRRVWLTFDDGSHPALTERVLETLEKYDIKATFFVIGRNARAHERIVREAFDVAMPSGTTAIPCP